VVSRDISNVVAITLEQ